MDWFAKSFLKASVSWFVLGGLMGLAMAVKPEWIIYAPAHAHMLLLGFVTMMIFGVGYHVIPRFAGTPIRDRRAPTAHWWMANAGLALMVIGFALRARGATSASLILSCGGALYGLGAFVFAVVIWHALDRRPAARRPQLIESLKARP